MLKSFFITMFQGFIIGSAMMIPGVSGGTTAIVVGIYEKLIKAVSSFFKNIKENLLFLTSFCLGAGIGFLVFSRLLLYFILRWQKPAMFFFIGAILASIPILYKTSGVKKIKLSQVLFFFLGLALVFSLGFLPTRGESIEIAGLTGFLMLFATGLIASFSLVLPGISTFHMLLVLGMYEPTLSAISNLNILFLAPIALGALLGIALITRIIEKALTKYPQLAFFTIIGFVIGSIKDIIPEFPTGFEILICALMLCLGFALLFFITLNRKNK